MSARALRRRQCADFLLAARLMFPCVTEPVRFGTLHSATHCTMRMLRYPRGRACVGTEACVAGWHERSMRMCVLRCTRSLQQRFRRANVASAYAHSGLAVF